MVAGPGHRVLLPASALGGALLVVAGRPGRPHPRRLPGDAARRAHRRSSAGRPSSGCCAAPGPGPEAGDEPHAAAGCAASRPGAPVPVPARGQRRIEYTTCGSTRRTPGARRGRPDGRAGEVLALVGPNGAGKSTLLAAVCGDVARPAGEIELDGAPLAQWTSGGAGAAPGRCCTQQAMSASRSRWTRWSGWAGRRGRAARRRRATTTVVAEALRGTDVARFAERPFPRSPVASRPAWRWPGCWPSVRR